MRIMLALMYLPQTSGHLLDLLSAGGCLAGLVEGVLGVVVETSFFP